MVPILVPWAARHGVRIADHGDLAVCGGSALEPTSRAMPSCPGEGRASVTTEAEATNGIPALPPTARRLTVSPGHGPRPSCLDKCR